MEICLNGLWGSVCDNNWDIRDSTVVCRQLGYSGCKFTESILIRSVIFILYILSASIPVNRHFILSNAPSFFHLGNVDCIGNESVLSECEQLPIGVRQCYVGFDEAGAVCNSKQILYRM